MSAIPKSTTAERREQEHRETTAPMLAAVRDGQRVLVEVTMADVAKPVMVNLGRDETGAAKKLAGLLTYVDNGEAVITGWTTK